MNCSKSELSAAIKWELPGNVIAIVKIYPEIWNTISRHISRLNFYYSWTKYQRKFYSLISIEQFSTCVYSWWKNWKRHISLLNLYYFSTKYRQKFQFLISIRPFLTCVYSWWKKLKKTIVSNLAIFSRKMRIPSLYRKLTLASRLRKSGMKLIILKYFQISP